LGRKPKLLERAHNHVWEEESMIFLLLGNVINVPNMSSPIIGAQSHKLPIGGEPAELN